MSMTQVGLPKLKSGDSVFITSLLRVTGFVTSGGREFIFILPTVYDFSGTSYLTADVVIRQNGKYLGGYDGNNPLKNQKASQYFHNAGIIQFSMLLDEALSDIINNDVVAIDLSNAKLTVS